MLALWLPEIVTKSATSNIAKIDAVILRQPLGSSESYAVLEVTFRDATIAFQIFLRQ